MNERLYEINRNTRGTPMRIIRYENCADIDVEFLDEFHYIKEHQTYRNFQRGVVKNPYDRVVHGVGYIGLGDHPTKVDGKTSRTYNVWHEIIARCYGEKEKEKYPQVRFMLLGACEGIQDSFGKDYLLPYIEQGIIEYFGETDRVVDYYKQCSVYVLPSYREGTPRTVLEAMSMGRAIITTDAPGCRETVVDGKTGFLVRVKNVEDIVSKMIEFIENPKLVEDMGKEAAKYCREKYDVNKVNNDMCDFLKI